MPKQAFILDLNSENSDSMNDWKCSVAFINPCKNIVDELIPHGRLILKASHESNPLKDASIIDKLIEAKHFDSAKSFVSESKRVIGHDFLTVAAFTGRITKVSLNFASKLGFGTQNGATFQFAFVFDTKRTNSTG